MLPRLWSLALAAVVGLLPIAPAEHVHEVEEHGHVEFVVHRHAQAHTAAAAPVHSLAHPEVDHPDAPIATLDQEYIVPTATRVAATVRLVVLPVLHPPSSAHVRVDAVGFVERLIHGPPRAPAIPRGPPSLLAS